MKNHTSNFKIGQKIDHYCCGIIVTGEIYNLTDNEIHTNHRPVAWDNDIYTQTCIIWDEDNEKFIPKIIKS